MSSDQPSSTAKDARSDITSHSAMFNLRWWAEVAKVRLRFFLIVLIAAMVTSQWPVLKGVWERWTWRGHRHEGGAVSSSHEYFCPMDAGVISVWPAICPICNMDLVPRKKMEAQMLPDGVITRMQLSPYRIQLAGIRTSTIELRSLKFEKTFNGVLRRTEDGKLGFQAKIAETDISLFKKTQTAEVHVPSRTEPIAAEVTLDKDGKDLQIRVVRNDASTLSPGNIATVTVSLTVSDDDQVLSIPESAVIDRGRERLVYVETMPGLFDGVAVELGRRCGGYYPVTKGLTAGQRVATTGAFLIDAETRLNPSLAAGYFGANQSDSKALPVVPPQSSETTAPVAGLKAPRQKLSQEDQSLADRQRICPVTELPLDSMGGPIPVMVSGQKIFICCAGCAQRLKDDPRKYLARIENK